MARNIYCEIDHLRMKALAEKFGEFYEAHKGKAQRDYLCDSCSTPIHSGEECFAATLTTTMEHAERTSQRVEDWAGLFINITEE